jgi:hypothetical protein
MVPTARVTAVLLREESEARQAPAILSSRLAFDKALRELVKQVFPDAALKELPAEHPIFSGKVGGRIESVTYSPAVKAESPDLKHPVLYALTP